MSEVENKDITTEEKDQGCGIENFPAERICGHENPRYS